MKMSPFMMRFARCFRGRRNAFVVDDNAILVGVLSRKDLLRASIGKQELPSIPVHIIMTRMPNITLCRRDDFILDIAKMLIENKLTHCLL